MLEIIKENPPFWAKLGDGCNRYSQKYLYHMLDVVGIWQKYVGKPEA